MIRLFGKSFATSNSQNGLEDGTNLKHHTSISCDVNDKNSQARKERDGKCIPVEGGPSTSRSQGNDQEQGEAISGPSSQEHTLIKKPDKIIPCPRCTSMDTKFCYYNNYNVNQPRHFCRKCQRYWTAGGIMRSVPVGSGRRKNNNKHTHALQSLQVSSNSLEGSTRSNDTYAGFGSNVAFCESTSQQSGFASDQFSNSDQMGSTNAILGSNFHGFPLQVPFYAMPHWPTVWPCNMSGPWPTPDSLNQSLLSSSSSSQTLGKHTRDDEANNINAPCNSKSRDDAPLRSETRLKGGVWVPKTLRFDDPNGASKGSIWATSLGINTEGASIINSRGLFKDLQSKKDLKDQNHRVNTSSVLQANPAAMSRSQNFRETM